jgi:hypothetical protein
MTVEEFERMKDVVESRRPKLDEIRTLEKAIEVSDVLQLKVEFPSFPQGFTWPLRLEEGEIRSLRGVIAGLIKVRVARLRREFEEGE